MQEILSSSCAWVWNSLVLRICRYSSTLLVFYSLICSPSHKRSLRPGLHGINSLFVHFPWLLSYSCNPVKENALEGLCFTASFFFSPRFGFCYHSARNESSGNRAQCYGVLPSKSHHCKHKANSAFINSVPARYTKANTVLSLWPLTLKNYLS